MKISKMLLDLWMSLSLIKMIRNISKLLMKKESGRNKLNSMVLEIIKAALMKQRNNIILKSFSKINQNLSSKFFS